LTIIMNPVRLLVQAAPAHHFQVLLAHLALAHLHLALLARLHRIHLRALVVAQAIVLIMHNSMKWFVRR